MLVLAGAEKGFHPNKGPAYSFRSMGQADREARRLMAIDSLEDSLDWLRPMRREHRPSARIERHNLGIRLEFDGRTRHSSHVKGSARVAWRHQAVEHFSGGQRRTEDGHFYWKTRMISIGIAKCFSSLSGPSKSNRERKSVLIRKLPIFFAECCSPFERLENVMWASPADFISTGMPEFRTPKFGDTKFNTHLQRCFLKNERLPVGYSN